MAEREYAPLEVRVAPPPVTHLNYRMLGLVALLVLALASTLTLAFYGTSAPARNAEEAPPLPPASPEGDVLLGMPRTYGDMPQPVQPIPPPRAIPLPPVVPSTPMMTASLQPLVPPQAPTPPVTPVVFTPPAGPAQPVVTAAPVVPPPQQAPRQTKDQSKWGIDLTHTQQHTTRQLSPKEQEDTVRRDAAKNLLKHAIWASPSVPTKTLYRQQAIPGVTIDEMVSDIPGQYKIRVTVPVFDRFKREVELIPKDSIIIITQKRVPGYGDKRLELGVEEIQPPHTPEVISLKAAVSDKEGGAGIKGDIDNHIPALVLATVISTAVNVGGRVLAGSPQGYQYSVGQEVVRDAGQQVSQDSKGIVDRTLRIPPTITIPAHTPVSISLQENVMFSRAPITVR